MLNPSSTTVNIVRRRRPSLTKSLLNSAVAFMGQAVNLQNETQVAHRHEKVAIAMLTAWEKILKAYLYRNNRKSIYYPKPKAGRNQPKEKSKTLALPDCLVEVHKILGRDFEGSVETLKQGAEYRNECIHMYGEPLDAILMPLFTQCGLYFSQFLRTHFGRELFSELGLAILPVAYQHPFTLDSFLTTHDASAGASKEVVDFLQGLTDAGKRLYENNHTDCILVEYHLALVSTKKAGGADKVVHVDNAASTELTFRVERPIQGEIRLTSDKKAQVVRLSDDELMHYGYTLSYQNLMQLVKKEGYKFEQQVRDFVKHLEQDNELCRVRYLDPGNLKSTRRCFYHVDAQARLVDYLTKSGVHRETND